MTYGFCIHILPKNFYTFYSVSTTVNLAILNITWKNREIFRELNVARNIRVLLKSSTSVHFDHFHGSSCEQLTAVIIVAVTVISLNRRRHATSFRRFLASRKLCQSKIVTRRFRSPNSSHELKKFNDTIPPPEEAKFNVS